jgi:hypothetical protein
MTIWHYVHKYIIVYSMIIFIKVYFHSKITKLFVTLKITKW